MGRFSLTPQPKPEQPKVEPRPAPAPAHATKPQFAAEPHAKKAGSSSPALDLRLRLHARLIEELDLAKLDKLDEPELRRQVHNQVGEFARGERMVINTKELEELSASRH